MHSTIKVENLEVTACSDFNGISCKVGVFIESLILIPKYFPEFVIVLGNVVIHRESDLGFIHARKNTALFALNHILS